MGFFDFGPYSWWWLPVLLWSLFWKGWALWQAAGKKDKVWFVIIFLVNTVGLLEIFYLYLWPKMAGGKKVVAS
jgi:hypothetical protein